MNSNAPDPLAATVAEALDHQLAGRFEEALTLYEEVLNQQPNQADALHYRGVLAYQMGDNKAAIDFLRRALQVDPDRPAAWCDLGAALRANRELEDAQAALDKAIHADPGLVEAYLNIGLVYQDQGALEDAVKCLRRAVALAPALAEAHHLLGVALMASFELDAAIAAFRKTIEIQPDHAQAYCNIGNAYRELRNITEAQKHYLKAVEIDPDFAEAHSNFGITCKDQGRIAVTVAAFRRAVEIDPMLNLAWSNLLFALCFKEDEDPDEVYRAHLEFDRRYAAPLKSSIEPHDSDPEPDRRLRIGYVSPDFRIHPGGHYHLPIVEGLDREEFEVTCYSSSTKTDRWTARFEAAADRWRDVVPMSDEELAEQIRADGIDILVDCAGHMSGNRLLAFARKPAPIQVEHALYPNTSGLSTMDYRILDEPTAPPSADARHTEEIVRMPEAHYCYRPLDIDVEPARSPPSAKTGVVTLGSFNNYAKVGPSTVAAWSRILTQAPNTRLALKWVGIRHGDPAWCLDRFAAHGVDPGRIDLLEWALDPYTPYRDIDICLDTFHASGGTTTCDALWMGVPVVAMYGEAPFSRVGLLHLTKIGLPELVTDNPDDYVAVAVGLAGDPDRLAEVRTGLRERFQNSAIMDEAGYVRDLSAEFRRMWRRWCEAQT